MRKVADTLTNLADRMEQAKRDRGPMMQADGQSRDGRLGASCALGQTAGSCLKLAAGCGHHERGAMRRRRNGAAAIGCSQTNSAG